VVSNFKNRRIRNKKHILWLREMPCAFCKAPPPSEASHIRLLSQSGTGLKPSDNRALPSCHTCHMEAHRIGERSFYGDNLDAAIKLAERLYERTGRKDECLWLMVGWKDV
jgi:hypothetical protein